jgi:hypothetical protein
MTQIFFRVAKRSARKVRKIAPCQLSARQPIGWRLLLASCRQPVINIGHGRMTRSTLHDRLSQTDIY